jgi:hypothetical protein
MTRRSHSSTWGAGTANRIMAHKQPMTVRCGCTLSAAVYHRARAVRVLGVGAARWGKKLAERNARFDSSKIPIPHCVHVLKIGPSAPAIKLKKMSHSCTERAWDHEILRSRADRGCPRYSTHIWGSAETLFPRVVGATEILALRCLSTLYAASCKLVHTTFDGNSLQRYRPSQLVERSA